MRRTVANLGLAALAALTLTLSPAAMAPAAAQPAAAKAAVDSGKARGLIGEQADGYLGVVSDADPTLRAAMEEINAGRAQAYQAIAAKTGVSPVAAGQATARELFARLPPGAYYRADGGWRRK